MAMQNSQLGQHTSMIQPPSRQAGRQADGRGGGGEAPVLTSSEVMGA